MLSMNTQYDQYTRISTFNLFHNWTIETREYKNCVNNINGWLLQVKPSAETLYIIPWR